MYYGYRLCGYLNRFYGSSWLLYEANSQNKTQHLTLGETRMIGALLFEATANYLTSSKAREIRKLADKTRRQRGRSWLYRRGGFEIEQYESLLKLDDLLREPLDLQKADKTTPRYQKFEALLEQYPEYR